MPSRERCRRRLVKDSDGGVFKEIGVHRFSLQFKDSRAEEGFLGNLSDRLPRSMIYFGFVVTVSQMGMVGIASFLPEHYPNKNVYTVRLTCQIIDLVIWAIGLFLLLLGASQFRRRLLSAESLERIVSTCMLCMLLLFPFTETAYTAALIGYHVEAGWDLCGTSDTWLLLFLDTIVTCVCLMPLRWRSTCILNCLSTIWFPLIRQVLLGDIHHWNFAFSMFLLSMMGIVGKRGWEIQERHLFSTIAKERTLRARSEFALSQREDFVDRIERVRRLPASGAVSIAPSYKTADMFDMVHSEESVKERFERIKATAFAEHWLVDPADVGVNPVAMLGKGGFGAVFEGHLKRLPVAIKVALGTQDDEVAKRTAVLLTELRILRKLRHPNIVMFHGAMVDSVLCEVALVIEMVHGPTIGKFVRSHSTPLADQHVYALTCGIVRAIHYLHEHDPPIVHADLKPNNVLVMSADSRAPCAKVVDFGLSRILSGKVRALGGTMAWMAPELLSKNRKPKPAVDVYGVGRVIMYMMSRREPFLGKKASKIRQSMLAGELPESHPPDGCSDFFTKLWIIGEPCTSARPSDRPYIDEIREQMKGIARMKAFRALLTAAAWENWGFCLKYQTTQNLDGEEPEGAPELLLSEALPFADALPKLREQILKCRKSSASSRLRESRSSRASTSRSSRLPAIVEVPGEEGGDGPKSAMPLVASEEESKQRQTSRSRSESRSGSRSGAGSLDQSKAVVVPEELMRPQFHSSSAISL